MSRAIPQIPSVELVQHYLDVFQADERYFLADRAILDLVEKFPKNAELEHILLKVTAINDLYGTNIYATFTMAHHIHTLRIDPELAATSTEIVDKIAAAEFSGKPRNVFSFASKYCSWHDPLNYPLYDSYVEKLLLAYRRKDKFTKFKNADLRRYCEYKRIVLSFREHYQLGCFSFKQLDKFLWLYGKELYPKKYKSKTPKEGDPAH